MAGDEDIDRYFDFAKNLTLEAGKIIKDAFNQKKNVETKTSMWDLVTEYDKNVEEFLIERLASEFPDHRFIAEETSSREVQIPELTDAPTWIIDPIDGTTNFVHSFPHTCISIGLAIEKQLEIGIIYNPSNDELYTAKKGRGAFLNSKPIRTSNVTKLNKSLLVLELTVIREMKKDRDIYLARLDALLSITQGIRSVGSIALALAYVANGSIDIQHFDYMKPWDVAAGILLVREAGGTVIDTKGGTFDLMRPRMIAAANVKLAQDTSRLIVDTDLKTQRKRLQRT